MTYEEALDYIASLAPRGWRLGLDRMQALVDRAGLQDSLGAPRGPQYIHVAGTNGKGSVTAYLQNLMVESGARTGAFFSPFVHDPRERVQFGRDLISEADLARLTETLMPVAESFSGTEFGGVTEFEFKTALGFLYWKEKKCDWVALEVGLGGRLDATNVVTPRSSVIVSIGLDHTAILGNTVEEIAYEKAGVIKPGVPVVVGQMPPGALQTIEAYAKEMGAPVWRFGREVQLVAGGPGAFTVTTPAGSLQDVQPGIRGHWQPHNVALAIAAAQAAGLNLEPSATRRAIQATTAPGRWEVQRALGVEFLFDGAHNEDAAKALALSLAANYPKDHRFVLVTNMVAGHDPVKFYSPLAPYIQSAHVVPIDFHRALTPEQTKAALDPLMPCVTAYDSVQDGLWEAVADSKNGRSVLVTGSFYLVGEVRRALRAIES